MSKINDLMRGPTELIHTLTDDAFTLNGETLQGTFSNKVQMENPDDYGPRYRWVMQITAPLTQFATAGFVAAMVAKGCPQGDDGLPILLGSTVVADGQHWELREWRREGNAAILGLVEEPAEVRP